MANKRRAEKRGGSSRAAHGSASINGLFVGEWCAETIWQRAERARVFLAIMGYATADETDSIAKRIRRDKTPEGMRLNRIETLDGKPVRCFIEDK